MLRVRGERKRALLLGARFFSRDLAEVHKITVADIMRAWEIFQQFDDKGWSFTDCTSKAEMEQLGVKIAFALDHHFKQFGTIQVVP